MNQLLNKSAEFAIRLLWATFIVVPSIWLLSGTASQISSLSGAESVAAAAWVQAVGSISAIIGAAVFPYWHDAQKEKRKDDRLRRIVLLLARAQQENLRLLHSTLFNAYRDFGAQTINPYVEHEWPMKWPPHIEALRAIPITDLDPDKVYMLNELKVGADYAWAVCGKLETWNVQGDREQLIVQQLKHYWVMAGLAVELLNGQGKTES